MVASKKYYAYVLLDPRKPGRYEYGPYRVAYLPFYVGKGTGNRTDHHTRYLERKNDFKARIIRKILAAGLQPIVRKKEGLTETQAFSLEKKLIRIIGRHPLGPLTNLTNGGEGASGSRWSEEAKRKKSEQTKRVRASMSVEIAEVSQKKRTESIRRAARRIGEGVQKAFANQSPEMKEYLTKVHSRIAKSWWKDVPENQREGWQQRMTENYQKWREGTTEEERRRVYNSANAKRAAKRKSRTPEQESEFRRKLSAAVKASYARRKARQRE